MAYFIRSYDAVKGAGYVNLDAIGHVYAAPSGLGFRIFGSMLAGDVDEIVVPLTPEAPTAALAWASIPPAGRAMKFSTWA